MMKPSADSSSLSSAPPSEEEKPKKPTLKLSKGKLTFGRKNALPESSPEPDHNQLGREPSPPHEYVLADNPDIAFIVMFRSRFSEAFPKNVPNLGPQDLEHGAVSSTPSEQIENVLCALLSLVHNRKKNVERGHHGRALEDAISSHRHQWPPDWNGKNPLSGSKTFDSLDPPGRLNLLRTLILWCINTSDMITAMIKDSYKQSRHDDDLNQPLFVPPWGADFLKRNYFLIEGQHDTGFRVYREENRKKAKPGWYSIAGSIEEAQKLARDLRAENGQAAHRLANRITQAVPLLEQREDKRKRKEYRQQRKAAFTRPEPGFSLYEGRTRGKRMRYTYEDGEDVSGTDDASNLRSTRPSSTSTPAAQGPAFTTSGRRVRSRFRQSYGETGNADGDTPVTGDDGEEDELSAPAPAPRGDGRARRTGRVQVNGAERGGRRIAGYNDVDEMDEESDADSTGNEWDGDDNDFEGNFDDDEDEAVSDETDNDSFGEDDMAEDKTMLVKLKYPKHASERVAGLFGSADGRDSSPDPLHQDHYTTPQKQQQHNQALLLKHSPYTSVQPTMAVKPQQPIVSTATPPYDPKAYAAPTQAHPQLPYISPQQQHLPSNPPTAVFKPTPQTSSLPASATQASNHAPVPAAKPVPTHPQTFPQQQPIPHPTQPQQAPQVVPPTATRPQDPRHQPTLSKPAFVPPFGHPGPTARPLATAGASAPQQQHPSVNGTSAGPPANVYGGGGGGCSAP